MELNTKTKYSKIISVDCDEREIANKLIESKNLEQFYVCNLNDIVEKHKKWIRLMPMIKTYYAVKCNNNPHVLKLLSSLNVGFDCASKSEIKAILNLGVEPERIIYAHPVKPISHIKYASSRKVKYTTFDSEVELNKCKKFYPNAKLIIRIRCDSDRALIKFGAKFGCDAYEEASDLLNYAKELDLDVVGVSFHVGTGCGNKFIYRKAIESAKHVFNLSNSFGFNFEVLDIGGGFPGDKTNNLEEFAEVINASINEHFGGREASLKIIAEPGTYYVRSAFTLYCSVHGVKRTSTSSSPGGKIRYMYYVGDGVFNSFAREGYKVETTFPKLFAVKGNEIGRGELFESIVWGQTCDSLDRIVEKMYLPEVNLGDWLIFENMGDYSISVSSNFNGFSAPFVYVIAANNAMSAPK